MSEIITRTLSGGVYIALITVTTLKSPILFSVLFAILMVIGSFEFAKLKGISSVLLITTSVVLFLASQLVFFVDIDFDKMYFGLSIVSVASAVYLFFELFKTKQISSFFLFIVYLAIPLLLLIYLQSQYKMVVLSIFMLIWSNDTFAYLSGKSFGKTKLFPSVSPKKTIEGFAGGMICTIFVALMCFYFQIVPQFNVVVWVVFAILISVFGSVGDLVQSKMKRVAGVKDSGNIMPGHGGVLDRLDSVIFVTPIIYLLVKLSVYVS